MSPVPVLPVVLVRPPTLCPTARPADPQQSRQVVERTLEHFKHRARRSAHRWGADEHDRQRRYRRHLAKLRAAVDRATDQHADWRRNILDDVGESLDEAV